MNEEVVGTIGGVVGLIVLLLIPLVVILTSHQRKMAEMIHGKRTQLPNPEVETLRKEMAEVRELLHQQMIAIDNLSRINAPLNGHNSDDSVRNRLEIQGGA
jgi:hypothetical protein